MPGRCPGTLFFFWAGGTWWRDSPLGCAGTVGRGWSARGPVVLLDWVGRSWIVAALHCRKDRFVECGVGFAGTARSTAGAGFPGGGPCPRWGGGCGCWWPAGKADAGASGAAFPRWSVGTIPLRFSSCSLAAGWEVGPAGRAVRGRTGFRGRKQPFGAEPVGGVRNREKGASCLSAASFCPAGCAARRPGSSQRQGCPFFWFFSLGRQRKERHPAGGRWHFGGAGGWKDQADRL